MSSVENEVELKPCPFCTNIPSVTTEGFSDGKPPLRKWTMCDTSGCVLQGLEFLVEKWNTRAPAPPVPDNSAFIYATTLKLAIETVKGLKVAGASPEESKEGAESDRAYNQALDDAIAALEVLSNANAPTAPPSPPIQERARRAAEKTRNAISELAAEWESLAKKYQSEPSDEERMAAADTLWGCAGALHQFIRESEGESK
jgi:hypothetical protein